MFRQKDPKPLAPGRGPGGAFAPVPVAWAAELASLPSASLRYAQDRPFDKLRTVLAPTWNFAGPGRSRARRRREDKAFALAVILAHPSTSLRYAQDRREDPGSLFCRMKKKPKTLDARSESGMTDIRQKRKPSIFSFCHSRMSLAGIQCLSPSRTREKSKTLDPRLLMSRMTDRRKGQTKDAGCPIGPGMTKRKMFRRRRAGLHHLDHPVVRRYLTCDEYGYVIKRADHHTSQVSPPGQNRSRSGI